jgi:outer membrane protein insertion porin family
MKRTFFLLLTAIVLLCAGLPAAAQKFLPKTIQFKGAPEYSNQELLDAAGLKMGAVLSSAEMKEHSQTLMDTGVFEGITYTFDGVDLVYSLTPFAALYPVRLVNLPLTPGKELDAALHDRFPLYHGKAPIEGGLLDSVLHTLEEMLAAQGIQAKVTAVPFTDQRLRQVTAISVAISNPPVQVGEIHLDGASAAIDPAARQILARLTGSSYDLEGTPRRIEVDLGNYYRDKGYLEAAIRATAERPPVVTPEAVHISLVVSVLPGQQYKLAGVQLASDLPVTQAEYDRLSKVHPGAIAEGQRMREDWQLIERQYHYKGFMKAEVHSTPSFDRTRGTVNFAVTVDPGPVYQMGKLTIQNSAEDLRAAMLAAWKLPAGAVFSEEAIGKYYLTQGANTALGRTFASANCKYILTLNDDTHTVDVVLRLEKRP